MKSTVITLVRQVTSHTLRMPIYTVHRTVPALVTGGRRWRGCGVCWSVGGASHLPGGGSRLRACGAAERPDATSLDGDRALTAAKRRPRAKQPLRVRGLAPHYHPGLLRPEHPSQPNQPVEGFPPHPLLASPYPLLNPPPYPLDAAWNSGSSIFDLEHSLNILS